MKHYFRGFAIFAIGFACFIVGINNLNRHKSSTKLSNEMQLLNETLQIMCTADAIWPKTPFSNKNLFCFCKKHPNWRAGCLGKVEILNREPIIAIVHKYFNHEIDAFRQNLKSKRVRKAIYTNKFGYSWTSNELLHKSGMLNGTDITNNRIYIGMKELLNAAIPCNGYPTMNIAKYERGHYLKVHHDGYGSHISNTSWTESFANIIRSVLTIFENCRHIYTDINMIRCLYLRSIGTLDSTLYWSTLQYGSPVASGMVQLSAVEGGETIFPRLNLSVHTNRGDFLYFENTDKMGRNMEESLHGACPVLSEEKLIIVGRIPGLCNRKNSLRKGLMNAFIFV